MTKTASIINLKEGMTSEELEAVGSDGQILLVKSENGSSDDYECFNSVEEATVAKQEWEK